MVEEKPLSPKEAAEYLSMKEGTLNVWRSKGKGPKFYKPSGGRGNIYYYKSDLDAFVKGEATAN